MKTTVLLSPHRLALPSSPISSLPDGSPHLQRTSSDRSSQRKAHVDTTSHDLSLARSSQSAPSPEALSLFFFFFRMVGASLTSLDVRNTNHCRFITQYGLSSSLLINLSFGKKLRQPLQSHLAAAQLLSYSKRRILLEGGWTLNGRSFGIKR